MGNSRQPLAGRAFWYGAELVRSGDWIHTLAAAADNVDYLRDVKPILATRCYRCHSSLEQESNYRLDSVPALVNCSTAMRMV